jgi:2-polyprenyl-6-methoxyphenol hydroxylase-like FAD-dependent oxidoreductase
VVEIADFTHLPTRCKYVALMPQWDFLNFLASHGKQYRAFDLRMSTEATGLIEDCGRIAGVRATSPDGDVAIRADLTVGCDGRHSTLRAAAGLASNEYGAPMDVLWFRLSRKPNDTAETFGHAEAGALMAMLDRGDYWQCAFVIPKGGIEQVKSEGLDAFRRRVPGLSPFVADRMDELRNWDDIKLLSVAVDRLRKWHQAGLLCIGDAAHAMSPIGGVGINLAVQDAVAAANILAAPLRENRVSESHLHDVEQRRLLPVRFTQWLQLTIQKRVIAGVLQSKQRISAPLMFRLMRWLPFLRRIPARLIGIGIRPEHVQTPDVGTVS